MNPEIIMLEYADGRKTKWLQHQILDKYQGAREDNIKLAHLIINLINLISPYKTNICSVCLTEVSECGTVLTAASSAAWVHKLKQFRIDGLACLLQHSDEVSCLSQVSWGEEGVGRALVGTAGCAPNTMDIILRGARIVIVDDELDILHIFWIKPVLEQGRK